MRTLANILWHFPFFGFVTALINFLVGSLLTVMVIPAPIGLGLIQLSKFQLAPFSYEMVSKDELGARQNPLWRTYSILIMILYLPFGCILAMFTICQIVGLCVSIIGIPAAVAVAKSLGTYFNPVGKVCVPVGVGEALQRQRAEAVARQYPGN